MRSRLPTYLHPVAGRPLLWHTVQALTVHERPPEEVLVVASDLSPDLFEGLAAPVRVGASGSEFEALNVTARRAVLVHGATYLAGSGLRRLLDAADDSWLGGGPGTVAAAVVDAGALPDLLRDPDSLSLAGRFASGERIEDGQTLTVLTRYDLAVAHRRIRDHLVTTLMENGATFLLPETVMVDVDVRVGRDSIIYPGVVLEGQTTVGEETVVGPGCRIINSWIGSGVELKGWNYIANTSVRNRAILEPYVRRGFD